jgi:hypothetical protein
VAPPAPAVTPKTTAVGVQAPAVDDGWDDPSRDKPPPLPAESTQPLPALAPGQASPAVSPASPPVAAGLALSAADLRLIVREMIDQAIAPLQTRLAELERRPRAPSAPAFAPPPPALLAHAAPAAVAAPVAPVAQAPAAVQAPPVAYASAMVAPAAPAAAPAPRSLIVALPPLLDVRAIERDVSVDIDVTGFDGGRRKRRMMLLFFLAVLVLFGGLFAMLALSYQPSH